MVVTSVDRDDLDDFGASVFAETIRAIKARRPDCRVEVLIPDFQGDEHALRIVVEARPDVLNHNTETVPRLYRRARPGGRYERALELLDRARTWRRRSRRRPASWWDSARRATSSWRSSATFDAWTARSSRSDSIFVRRWRTCRWSATTRPRSFASSRHVALDLGFGHVESGPLVRSSYHAHEQAESYDRATT